MSLSKLAVVPRPLDLPMFLVAPKVYWWGKRLSSTLLLLVEIAQSQQVFAGLEQAWSIVVDLVLPDDIPALRQLLILLKHHLALQRYLPHDVLL